MKLLMLRKMVAAQAGVVAVAVAEVDERRYTV